MRKVLLIIVLAVCVLAWAGRSQMAYAVGTTTIACQGHDTFPFDEIYPTTVKSTQTTVPAGDLGSAFIISDAAVWTVTTLNGKFTSGTLIATFQTCEGAFSCPFGLVTTASSFYTYNGITIQNLVWTSLPEDGCYDYGFADTVFLVTSGTQGVMNDDNLDDDDAPGSGTCLVH